VRTNVVVEKKTRLRKGKKSKLSKAGKVVAFKMPPDMQATLVHRHVFRFVSTSTNAVGFNSAVGAFVMGGMITVANTTVRTPTSSLRVNRVSIWSPAAAAGAVSPLLEWGGDGSALHQMDNVPISTTLGSSEPSYLTGVPPKDSFAGLWFQPGGTSTVIFTVQCSVGSIVDLDLSWTMTNEFLGFSAAIGGANPLSLWAYAGLDALRSALYTPVGLPLFQ